MIRISVLFKMIIISKFQNSVKTPTRQQIEENKLINKSSYQIRLENSIKKYQLGDTFIWAVCMLLRLDSVTDIWKK